MSEWVSVLAVFWILWAIDGARLGPRRSFTLVGQSFRGRRRGGGRGAWAVFSRLSRPGTWPGAWRMTLEEVPVSLAPGGVCNRPAGAAGRPAEHPAVAQAWRWEEVREVGLADGWVFVNGARFFPDTGHLPPRELLALARLAPAARGARIQLLMRRWFRPAHLRRRARVLIGRTRLPAGLNLATWAAVTVLTGYLAGDVAARIPAAWGEFLVAALPWLLLGFLAVHVAAVVIAWRVLRRLRPVRPEKRGAHYLSALLLPPQGLRLRAIAGDGFFPAQHPLAGSVAFGDREACGQVGFQVLADLRWPIGDGEDSPLVREVTAWFRIELEQRVTALLVAAGIDPAQLLAPPRPDGSASCHYCPRCRDQFGPGPTICPNGIALRPLGRPGE
jgi:hypothetical protein